MFSSITAARLYEALWSNKKEQAKDTLHANMALSRQELPRVDSGEVKWEGVHMGQALRAVDASPSSRRCLDVNPSRLCSVETLCGYHDKTRCCAKAVIAVINA